MRTRWHCERCAASGVVQHAKDADVWQVFQQIADAHRRKQAQKLVGCDTGVDQVRVRILKGKPKS